MQAGGNGSAMRRRARLRLVARAGGDEDAAGREMATALAASDRSDRALDQALTSGTGRSRTCRSRPRSSSDRRRTLRPARPGDRAAYLDAVAAARTGCGPSTMRPTRRQHGPDQRLGRRQTEHGSSSSWRSRTSRGHTPVLVNAIYLEAAWLTPFAEEATVPAASRSLTARSPGAHDVDLSMRYAAAAAGRRRAAVPRRPLAMTIVVRTCTSGGTGLVSVILPPRTGPPLRRSAPRGRRRRRPGE